jgi:hypothetical protein
LSIDDKPSIPTHKLFTKKELSYFDIWLLL